MLKGTVVVEGTPMIPPTTSDIVFFEMQRIKKEIETFLKEPVKVNFASDIFTLETYQSQGWTPVLIMDVSSIIPVEILGRCWNWLPYSRFAIADRLTKLTA